MLACTWILPVIFCKDIKSSDRILSGSHIMNQDQNIGPGPWPGRALKYDSTGPMRMKKKLKYYCKTLPLIPEIKDLALGQFIKKKNKLKPFTINFLINFKGLCWRNNGRYQLQAAGTPEMLNYILLKLLKNWTNLPTRFPLASSCGPQLWGFEKTFCSVLGPGDEDFSRWIILPSFLCFLLKSCRMSEINFSGESRRGRRGNYDKEKIIQRFL